jgi:cobalt-zinc-cadmium efflux system protein
MAHDKELDYSKAFAAGVILNAGYIVFEVVYGLLLNSVALLADAGHNASDVVSLLLAWGASYLGRLRPSERRTYGWRSSSILAALINALLLMVVVGGIAWESIRRVWQPQEVPGGAMMVVAGVGVAVNAATAFLFVKGRKRDLNLKAAFLHMAADAGISAGIVGAGAAIALTGRYWIDPAVSLAVAAVILIGTWHLLRDSLNLALHAVPAGVDTAAVKAYLSGVPGVVEVHDLHIWAMSTTETALTAHLVKPEGGDEDSLLSELAGYLHERFGIAHSTLQVERSRGWNRCRHRRPGAV